MEYQYRKWLYCSAFLVGKEELSRTRLTARLHQLSPLRRFSGSLFTSTPYFYNPLCPDRQRAEPKTTGTMAAKDQQFVQYSPEVLARRNRHGLVLGVRNKKTAAVWQQHPFAPASHGTRTTNLDTERETYAPYIYKLTVVCLQESLE
jgi:hypothetical protein